MNPVQLYEYGKNNALAIVPNTYIGGLSSTYPTKASLAIKLGILESDIPYYNTNGENIEAIIISNYSIAQYAFQNNLSLTHWLDNENKCTYLGGTCFYNTENLKRVKLNGVLTGNGYCFAEQESLLYLELTEMTIVDNLDGGGSKGSRFIDDSSIEVAIFPKLYEVKIFTFYHDGSSKKRQLYVYLPALRILGTSTGNNTIFNGVRAGAKYYFDPFLQTSNAGAEEADITNLRNQGATVVYILNYTAPSNVTDLSHSGGILSFTPPLSTNALDKYMVFVNDLYKAIINGSGSLVAGLVSGDKVRIVPFDIYFNRSESNIITI